MTQIKELAEHLTNTVIIQVPRFTIYTFTYFSYYKYRQKWVRIQAKPFCKKSKILNYQDAENAMRVKYPKVDFEFCSMLESFETKTIEIKLTSE
jgi:hypothetical protein